MLAMLTPAALTTSVLVLVESLLALRTVIQAGDSAMRNRRARTTVTLQTAVKRLQQPQQQLPLQLQQELQLLTSLQLQQLPALPWTVRTFVLARKPVLAILTPAAQTTSVLVLVERLLVQKIVIQARVGVMWNRRARKNVMN